MHGPGYTPGGSVLCCHGQYCALLIIDLVSGVRFKKTGGGLSSQRRLDEIGAFFLLFFKATNVLFKQSKADSVRNIGF